MSVLEEMFVAAKNIGYVEWGSTGELSLEEHLEYIKSSVENTIKSFSQEGDQAMHGLYLEGTDIVLCHTGTSPNSPTHARILMALWNDFVKQANEQDLGSNGCNYVDEA